jgi:hypothetical protein
MKTATTVAAALLLCAAAAAQDSAPAAHGAAGGLATRSVAQYTDLEQQLLQALRDHDRAAAQLLLAEDFEVRGPEGADAIAGAQWLDHSMQARPGGSRIQDLDAREFGDVATVSYLLHRKGRGAGAASPAFAYVVDVWRQSDHKLLLRYVSTPARHAAAAQGPDRRR